MGEDDRREDRILKNDPLMFVSKISEVDVFEIGDVMEFFWKSRKDIHLYKGCREYFNKNLSLDCMIQSIKNSLAG